MFQDWTGGFLFGALFRRSFGPPNERNLRWRSFVGQPRFYGEHLFMFRPFLFDEHVHRLSSSCGLQKFLKC